MILKIFLISPMMIAMVIFLSVSIFIFLSLDLFSTFTVIQCMRWSVNMVKCAVVSLLSKEDVSSLFIKKCYKAPVAIRISQVL